MTPKELMQLRVLLGRFAAERAHEVEIAYRQTEIGAVLGLLDRAVDEAYDGRWLAKP